MKKPKSLLFPVNIDTEEIIEALYGGLSHDQVFQFISDLDQRSEDWGLTEQLYEHFAKLHEIYLKEVEGEGDNGEEKA